MRRSDLIAEAWRSSWKRIAPNYRERTVDEVAANIGCGGIRLERLVMIPVVLLLQAAAVTQPPVQSAPAPVVDARPIVWNNLRIGMTKEEVKALYPKRTIVISTGCFMDVNPQYTSKKLSSVNVEYGASDVGANRCGKMVLATLVTKYGEPDSTEREVQQNDCGNRYAGGLMGALANLCKSAGGDEPDYFLYSRWTRDGIEITFKIDSAADNPHWWAIYRPGLARDPSMATKF